jgi:hypothetical protein
MDFGSYAQAQEALYLRALGLSAHSLQPLAQALRFSVKKILIVAPHPDDECLMSGFALRAKEEFQAEVAVLPFSYGSKLDRQAERKRELTQALQVLQFLLLDVRAGGFEELRAHDLVKALQAYTPDLIIFPHSRDGHPTHMKCSEVVDSSARLWAKTNARTLHLLESEYWQVMENPNLMIPLSLKEVTQMGAALMEHQGEVSRNPYHLTLPAWLMDCKRRGSERVSGMGSFNDASIAFAQLYRHTEL